MTKPIIPDFSISLPIGDYDLHLKLEAHLKPPIPENHKSAGAHLTRTPHFSEYKNLVRASKAIGAAIQRRRDHRKKY
jgi:hypothetical protein